MNKIDRDKLRKENCRCYRKNLIISSIILFVVSIITLVIFCILNFKFMILFIFLQPLYITIYLLFMIVKYNEFYKLNYILNREEEAEEDEADSDILQKEDD